MWINRQCGPQVDMVGIGEAHQVLTLQKTSPNAVAGYAPAHRNFRNCQHNFAPDCVSDLNFNETDFIQGKTPVSLNVLGLAPIVGKHV